MYTLNELIVWHVNYISQGSSYIKHCFKQKKLKKWACTHHFKDLFFFKKIIIITWKKVPGDNISRNGRKGFDSSALTPGAGMKRGWSVGGGNPCFPEWAIQLIMNELLPHAMAWNPGSIPSTLASSEYFPCFPVFFIPYCNFTFPSII